MGFLKEMIMRKFRFHLISLAHLPQNKTYMSCAFTQKNIKLSKMLMSLGHEVFFYGSEGSDVECTRLIQTHTIDDIRRDYGVGDNRFEIGYDWTNTDFKHDFNSGRTDSTLKFYVSCAEYINRHKNPDDFLLLTQGHYQKSISDAVNLYLKCEPGIGYRGSVRTNFRAFESSYIQNFTYGSEYPYECINGSFYDRVIPNYFDDNDMEFSDHKEDYYLFIGRMIKRKGIITAYLACKALDKKLIIAGQGAHVTDRGTLLPNVDPDFELPAGNWEYVGFVDTEKRKKLMSKAIATFTPTEYLECFAGTHIESMLHGTPPITTNFGVFPGTIPDCVNEKVGFRCNTLNDFVVAARLAQHVDHGEVRRYGQRFLMDKVKWQYQQWFEDLYQVYLSTDGKTDGWHYIKEGANGRD
jgi:glycosyltransferase involved in cell wall biosynthesis